MSAVSRRSDAGGGGQEPRCSLCLGMSARPPQRGASCVDHCSARGSPAGVRGAGLRGGFCFDEATALRRWLYLQTAQRAAACALAYSHCSAASLSSHSALNADCSVLTCPYSSATCPCDASTCCCSASTCPCSCAISSRSAALAATSSLDGAAVGDAGEERTSAAVTGELTWAVGEGTGDGGGGDGCAPARKGGQGAVGCEAVADGGAVDGTRTAAEEALLLLDDDGGGPGSPSVRSMGWCG